MSIVITLLALLIEATLGYPERVLRSIGHPVTWIGRMIDRARPVAQPRNRTGTDRKAAGFVAALLIAAIPAAAAYGIERGLSLLPFRVRHCRDVWLAR